MLIGVDTGGTRTTAAVSDDAGNILARAESGPGAIRPGQAAISASAVFAAARDALQRARVPGPAMAMVVGASGAGDPAQRDALAAALEGCGLASRLLVTTDAELALVAAHGDAPGIVLIAGTGSVAWARLPDGTTARAGGLGPVLGDGGSGHAIGLAALRAVAHGIDGGPPTGLAATILGALAIPLAALPTWSLAATVKDIAALAPIVLDAAANDGVARTIAVRGARHLGEAVAQLARRYPSGERIAIAMSGGLLSGRKDYREMVVQSIEGLVRGARVSTTPVDAVTGAIRIAQSLTR